jgi:predicted nucleic acid-binding protein
LIFLIDTCVLSEATKAKKNDAVAAWLRAQETTRQYVSAITIGELCYGAGRLPSGRRRSGIEHWIEAIREDYAGRIVPFDDAIAVRWGHLRAVTPNIAVLDSQIAATALTYGFTLVTRNVRDFRFDGLDVLDPWEQSN